MTQEKVGGCDGVETARLEGANDVGARETHVHHDLDANRVVEIGLRLDVGRQRTVLVAGVYPLVLHHRLKAKVCIRISI